MPEYQYAGLAGRSYPESRDARGVHVGDVEPGDTRDLDEPLDGDWRPAGTAARDMAGKPSAKGKAASAAPSSDKAGQPGTEEG